MAKRQLATLLTDFGTRDPYVAAMKGAILRMCPTAQLVDICHDVPGHDILTAGFILAQAAPYYPAETVHVVVVDPGVGTERRIMAAQFAEQIFVFPDNGVITFISEQMPMHEIAVVRDTKYLPASQAAVSRTFHGRDIFAPIAGHILNGLSISRLGPQPKTYKLLEIAKPREEGDELIGQIIYVDGFGNLISNIRKELVNKRWQDVESLCVTCAGRNVGPIQATYGFVDAETPLALFNSMDLVEVAVNRGRACDVLQAGRGSEVRVREAREH